jgi:predicted O-methyltransferase YrrM
VTPDKLKNRTDLADLLAARGYTIGAEVGTFRGEFAAVLLARVPLRKLYCVDLWNGCGMSNAYDGEAVMTDCAVRLAQFGNRSEMLRCDSVAGAKLWKMRNLDFVYVDADHSYAAAKADILAWLPCVRPGGIIAGHDYSNRHGKGVKQAVDEIFGNGVYTTAERCASWLVVKP